ncbi:hypothetical protein D3C85_1862890 [compost metagenome]
MPISAAPPSRDDTGCTSPENWMAGTMVAMATPNTAAIWLRMKVDISRPMPVATQT